MLSLSEKVFDDEISYKDFKSSIYGANDVREQLMNDQHEKCAFCECTLLDKDPEVEHFRPKTRVRQDKTRGNTIKLAYYWMAYDWDNLLYSCHQCNRIKGNYFPLKDPDNRFDIPNESPLLINPYTEDPADFIEFRQEKVFAKNNNAKGNKTIEVLGLNRKDLVELRRRRLKDFTIDMERQNISFDGKLKQIKQDAIRDERDPESIEFLGMYENQRYRF